MDKEKIMLEEVNLVIDEEVGSVSLFFFLFFAIITIILKSKEQEVWVRMRLERETVPALPLSPVYPAFWFRFVQKHQLMVLEQGKFTEFAHPLP